MTALRWTASLLLALLSAVAFVLGAVAYWGQNYLLNTAAFVELLQPLPQNSQVQQTAIEEITAEMEAWVAQFADEKIRPVPLLGDTMAEQVTTQSALLLGPAIALAAPTFFAEGAVTQVWDQGLTDVHTQLVTALDSNDPAAQVTLDVQPLMDLAVESARPALETEIEESFGTYDPRRYALEAAVSAAGSFAAPEMEPVVIMEVPNLSAWRPIYKSMSMGAWPYLLGGGVALVLAVAYSPRRPAALAVAGGAVAALAWAVPAAIGAATSADGLGIDPGWQVVGQVATELATAPLVSLLHVILWVGVAAAVVGVGGLFLMPAARGRLASH